MLHLISKSPFTHLGFKRCIDTAYPHDCILLLEDSVYAAIENAPFALDLQETINNKISCYALIADCEARGITKHIINTVNLITYEEFVELTIDHYPIHNW